MPPIIPRTVVAWMERAALIILTSLFHHFPMPTFVGMALTFVVFLANQKVPDDYRHWK